MMSNTDKKINFLDYIKTPLSKTSLNVIYKANDITFDRCQLFSDFTQSLIHKILDTYMGDTYTNTEQRLEHFNWCWDSVINDFMGENISFNNTDDLYDYFLQHMMDIFYTSRDKGDYETIRYNLIKLWKYILSNTTNKTRSDVDTFLDIYKLFEKTLFI